MFNLGGALAWTEKGSLASRRRRRPPRAKNHGGVRDANRSSPWNPTFAGIHEGHAQLCAARTAAAGYVRAIDIASAQDLRRRVGSPSMSTLSLSSVLFSLAATAGGSGVAWLATALHYRTKLAERTVQLHSAEQAKQKAQELALQARQQVETLQQALSEAKRDGAIHNAASSARAAAAAAEAAKLKARAELLRKLEAEEKPERPAHGFADTQPLH
jgi:hypothetical protein